MQIEQVEGYFSAFFILSNSKPKIFNLLAYGNKNNPKITPNNAILSGVSARRFIILRHKITRLHQSELKLTYR